MVSVFSVIFYKLLVIFFVYKLGRILVAFFLGKKGGPGPELSYNHFYVFYVLCGIYFHHSFKTLLYKNQFLTLEGTFYQT
jgi:hypothetical protein